MTIDSGSGKFGNRKFISQAQFGVNLSYLVEIPDFGSVESETEMDGDGNHTAISNTGMKFIRKYRCP